MAKIIQIEQNVVMIGMDDGSIKSVDVSCCTNFIPKVGDEVELFSSGDKLIITKKVTFSSAISDAQLADPEHRVNKIAYVLLAFFFGYIGIHKFYAGHIFLGILYLLFCWTFIPGLIAFIEAIIALCKQDDVHGNINA